MTVLAVRVEIDIQPNVRDLNQYTPEVHTIKLGIHPEHPLVQALLAENERQNSLAVEKSVAEMVALMEPGGDPNAPM